MISDYKLTILGTSAAKPTIDRNVSAHAVSIGGETILFDCGEGVTRSILRNKININSIHNIFISHLHIDHVGGLVNLLHNMTLHDRKDDLNIHGPKGLKHLINYGIKTLNIALDFKYNIHTVKPNFIPKTTLADKREYSGVYVKDAYVKTDKYKISVAKADHRIEAYAYRVNLNGKPGKFNIKKAKKLGIYGKDRGRLVKGDSVKINGRVIYPHEVVGVRKPGKSFGYSGDTRPTDLLGRFFKNVSCLLFDATYILTDQEKADKHGHTTSYDAGRIAMISNVDCLVLTHFSSSYKDTTDHLLEAKYNYHGKVICATDHRKLHIK